MSAQPPPGPANSDAPGRLPRGRHRLPSEAVSGNQRRRLILGTGQALADKGFADLTVSHVIEAAGVSRTTFYANFTSKHDCVLCSHRDVSERLYATVGRACAIEGEWPQRVRAAIAASFDFLVAEPGAAFLLGLNGAVGDLELARQVTDSNARLAALLRDGRVHSPQGPRLPEVTENVLVGALLVGAAARLRDRDAKSLGGLETEVVQLVLTPYIGIERAVAVAEG